MSSKIHSTERRGILAVALAALAVTAAGLALSMCRRSPEPPEPAQIRVLLDKRGNTAPDTIRRKPKNNRKTKNNRNWRTPLDEVI